MDEQSKGFRSAVFGGFKREDVLRFIEQTDKRYFEESESREKSLTESKTALEELRTQNDQLISKNAELLERLGEMTLDADEVRSKLDEIESGFTMQTSEVEAQSARAAALAEENDRLTAENAKLSEKCGEYAASKDKIAEMELSAYRRAKRIEEDAKNELGKLRRQSMEMIEQVKNQLDQTKENYRVMLSRSQAESAEMARRASEVIGEIDRISGSLGRSDAADARARGIREKLGGLRPKMEEQK